MTFSREILRETHQPSVWKLMFLWTTPVNMSKFKPIFTAHGARIINLSEFWISVIHRSGGFFSPREYLHANWMLRYRWRIMWSFRGVTHSLIILFRATIMRMNEIYYKWRNKISGNEQSSLYSRILWIPRTKNLGYPNSDFSFTHQWLSRCCADFFFFVFVTKPVLSNL